MRSAENLPILLGVKTNQLLPKVTMLVALMIAGAAAMARTAEAESIRIVAVDTLDQGTAAEGTTTDLGIDLSQGICGEVPNETDEPFYDTLMGISVRNPLSQEIDIRQVRYQLPITPGGRKVLSRVIAPYIGEPIAKNSTKRILAIFLKADSGAKKLLLSNSILPASLGIQNITVILTGRTSSGQRFTLRKRVSMAFANYDRCS